MKKLLSAALAAALCLTLAAPAAAAVTDYTVLQAIGEIMDYDEKTDTVILGSDLSEADHTFHSYGFLDLNTGELTFVADEAHSYQGELPLPRDGYVVVPTEESPGQVRYDLFNGRGEIVLTIPAGKYAFVSGMGDGWFSVMDMEGRTNFMNPQGELLLDRWAAGSWRPPLRTAMPSCWMSRAIMW